MKTLSTLTRHAKSSHGFSLIELMVVVAIAGILASLAVPSFVDTIDRQKLSAASSDLYASVAMSRNEAIRRGSRVDLRAINNSWNNGWEISALSNGNARETIYKHGPIPDKIVIDRPSFDVSLSYDGTGRTRESTNSQVVVTGDWVIKVNRTGSPHKRLLRINAVGRPLLCNPATDTTCV